MVIAARYGSALALDVAEKMLASSNTLLLNSTFNYAADSQDLGQTRSWTQVDGIVIVSNAQTDSTGVPTLAQLSKTAPGTAPSVGQTITLPPGTWTFGLEVAPGTSNYLLIQLAGYEVIFELIGAGAANCISAPPAGFAITALAHGCYLCEITIDSELESASWGWTLYPASASSLVGLDVNATGDLYAGRARVVSGASSAAGYQANPVAIPLDLIIESLGSKTDGAYHALSGNLITFGTYSTLLIVSMRQGSYQRTELGLGVWGEQGTVEVDLYHKLPTGISGDTATRLVRDLVGGIVADLEALRGAVIPVFGINAFYRFTCEEEELIVCDDTGALATWAECTFLIHFFAP
jgi:hypothetical protein